mmetsp:Transcript_15486/g.25338  ORF Transcript_15486/g.25338 Transcript_15486/m.25338 type:complete len:141 (-) Transcript_15486:1281-1703(-)|eukprot:CAMPEP_0203767922 /NCGR_PEP_ID=MMETSP0099_2-20121227/1281_1 /ASSEMBLY_ACC=CAM_ASM_000209 /TAXON_ID=96639 /ORGANISM=" , Strain NY0313808BC1" /LENGTH=140 /DNA_ID=CAMNT_0050664515 /DNA_START=62 /DNA_END=484 /DNA_ORIENTATION=-
MSGIGCEEECVEAFNKFKLQNNSKGEKHKYIIFKIKDEKIKIDKKGPADSTWDDFASELAGDEGAYGIFDYHFALDDGRQLDKIVYVQYTPDKGNVRSRMLYAATNESFKGELGSGISHAIQATSIADLEEESILALLKK